MNLVNEQGCGQLQINRHIYLQVDTNLGALNQVLSWFTLIKQPPLRESVWLQCQIALAEMFTNAVRHAHRGYPPETPIELEASLSPQGLEIRVWDCGPPYNLNQRLRSLPEAVSRSSEGGRGLSLIRDIADDYDYTRTGDNRNCFLIVKRLTKAQ